MNKTQSSCPTLEECFKSYLADRRDLRPGTIHSYQEVFKRADTLKDKPVDQIKFSDIKHLYAWLRYDKGYSPASIELLNAILVPTFNHAVRDDILPKNPAEGAYHEVARGDVWKSTHRPALTKHQASQFLGYVHHSPKFKHWEPLFITLFGTGLRVGEIIALRWEDVSFKMNFIKVNRSITFTDGKVNVGPPKTPASNRTIPMLSEVREALVAQNTYSKLTQVKNGENVPGKKGYIFLSSKGTVYYPSSINCAIDAIVKNYNAENLYDPLPHFSVHQIRHTFCSRLCEMDVNVKVIQSVMGHSDYQTTMDIYTDITDEKKQLDFSKLEGKLNLS